MAAAVACSQCHREPTIHRSKAVGEPSLMHALWLFSVVTHALASLAPGRGPPLDAPATPEAILWAADAMRGVAPEPVLFLYRDVPDRQRVRGDETFERGIASD